MRIRKNLTGQRFGKLVAISYDSTWRGWICSCDCGNESKVRSCNLLNSSVKSCGCIQHARRIQASLHALWRQYKGNAKARGYEFFLTIPQVKEITSRACVYCGSAPKRTIKAAPASEPYVYNGIDRRDNNLDYTLDNCIPCCIECNWMKRQLTVEAFLNHVRSIVSYQESL